MCGIAGVLRTDGATVDAAVVADMIGLLGHRGPDDAGLWVGPGVVLGHRRLVVVDPDGSRQPMHGPTGMHLVGNGEILNHRELRPRCDRALRTRGDMEVILALHESRGDRAVDELRGQFAYALYDDRDRSLRLVRDRLGILPLYWWFSEPVFAFASEPKALLPVVGRPALDAVSVADHLAGRAVPAPFTLFEGIRKLLPGHSLEVGAGTRPLLRRYWSVPAPSEGGAEGAVDPATAVRLVDGAVARSVRENLMADVPVGSLLSGGVDSSLVASLAQEEVGERMHTFSAGFEGTSEVEGGVDELPAARQVADLLGTQHHEVVVGPHDLERLWPLLTWHRDAPLSEPADVAVHQLAAAASEHVTVLLSGEGADELFGGYPKHRWAAPLAAADRIPRPLRAGAARWAGPHLPPSARRAGIALRALGEGSELARARSWFSPFDGAVRRQLVGDALVDASDARRTWPTPGGFPPSLGGTPLGRVLWADCHSWLSDNLLERADRMSMAASVELRPPLLDHRLVELAFGLPDEVKVRGRTGKWVLRQVAAERLPPEVSGRRKAGFPVPLAHWFRGPLHDFAHDTLTDPSSLCRELLDGATVRSLLADHRRGRRDEAIALWTLLGLEVWNQTFFRRTESAHDQLDPIGGGVR